MVANDGCIISNILISSSESFKVEFLMQGSVASDTMQKGSTNSFDQSDCWIQILISDWSKLVPSTITGFAAIALCVLELVRLCSACS